MPTLKLDADAKKGVQAFQELEKAAAKTGDQIELTAREAKQLERAAGRIARQNEGPQERYNRKMAELATLVKTGKISLDQAHTAATRYGNSLDKAGNKGKSVHGPNAMQSLTTLAGGYLSVAGAVGAITQALGDVEQQNQRVADSFFSGLGSIGELQQISATPQEFQKNLGFAKSLVGRGIFTNIGEASTFTAAVTNAGFDDQEKEFLATVGERKQVAAGGLVGFAQNLKKVQNLYGDLDANLAADKLIATSAGTQANATQTAAAAAQFSGASTNLGFSGDASMAALVMAENQAKNIDAGATQVGALFSSIAKRGLSTGTLRGTIESIQAREAAGENIYKDILGEENAVKGFRAISSDLARFDDLKSKIGGSAGMLEGRNFMSSDPTLRALMAKGQAEGAKDAFIVEKDSATKEALIDALLADDYMQEGGGFVGSLKARLGRIFFDYTGQEEMLFRGRVAGHHMGTTTHSDALQAQMVDYLERIANGVESGTTVQE